MTDTDDINEIFRIVDSDGSGYLDKQKLERICPHLSSSEIDSIFNDLDTDRDNRISLIEFSQGFKELIKPYDNHYLLCKKKCLNRESTIDKEDEDLTRDMVQMQINEAFNNLSWYENENNIE